jgi:phenylacetate-CoA ligase
MCRHAYSRAPMIKEVWDKAGISPSDVKSTEDFTNIVPFIDKDSIREYRDKHGDPSGGMGHYGPGEILAIGTTSGTTGDPTPLPVGKRTASEITFARSLWHLGLRPGDFHVALAFTFRGGHRRRYQQELGMTDIVFDMIPDEVPRICEASRIFRPTTIASLSNPMLLAFENYFDKNDIDPVDVFSSYKGAVFGGEPLSKRLEGVAASWGLDLYQNTTLGDVGSAAECRAKAGMHANEDIAFVECLDPVTGMPVADGGIGEMVVTSLAERSTPLVRFKTGDLIFLDRSRCACGSNHARFKVVGRTSDRIVVKGRDILPLEVMALVEQHSATRAGLFQIIRANPEMDVLRIRIGYDPQRHEGTKDSLRHILHDDLLAAFNVPVEIELVINDDLLKLGPPHKIPRVTKS